MHPYECPYNSGAIRIRLLPSPSVKAALNSGKPPVGYSPASSFRPLFDFLNRVHKFESCRGAIKSQLGLGDKGRRNAAFAVPPPRLDADDQFDDQRHQGGQMGRGTCPRNES